MKSFGQSIFRFSEIKPKREKADPGAAWRRILEEAAGGLCRSRPSGRRAARTGREETYLPRLHAHSVPGCLGAAPSLPAPVTRDREGAGARGSLHLASWCWCRTLP